MVVLYMTRCILLAYPLSPRPQRSTANRLAKLEYRTCPTLGRVGTSIDGQRARGMSDASMSSASTAPGGIKSLKVELNLDSWLEGYDFPHRPLFQVGGGGMRTKGEQVHE